MGRAPTVVRIVRKMTILEDVPDNRILECAVAAQADFIVTGDYYLPKLRVFEGISMRLADFLRAIPL